jgi:hypothetical protein
MLIMDDIVNAIDDDHRSGIRRVLFQYDRLKDKQVIITSHSEEFIQNAENEIPAKEYDDLINKIIFLTPQNRQLQHLEKVVSNYLKKSNESLTKGQKRDALADARRALEALTNKLWNKLDKDINSAVNVKMRPTNKRLELMSLVNGLKISISKKANHLKYANESLPILEYLTGLKTKYNLVWNYLNAGTHEEIDRDDFEEEIVQEIIQKLTELDTIIKS